MSFKTWLAAPAPAATPPPAALPAAPDGPLIEHVYDPALGDSATYVDGEVVSFAPAPAPYSGPALLAGLLGIAKDA